MSEQTDNANEDDTQEPKPNWRRDLESRASTAETEAEALKAKLSEMERDIAFRDAGLDKENPQHVFFKENYKGDLSVDAVKTKATELGFLAAQDAGTTQAAEAHNRMDRASAGAEAPAAYGSDQQKADAVLTPGMSQAEFWNKVKAAGWDATS